MFGVVAAPDDIMTDRQARDAGAIVPFADGSMETVSSPLWIAGQTKPPPRHAPELGEHSEDVLRDAGFAEAEIDAFAPNQASSREGRCMSDYQYCTVPTKAGCASSRSTGRR